MNDSMRVVGPNGEVTIPAAIRRRFDIRPGDHVRFFLENGGLRVVPVESMLRTSYQSVPALNPPRTWREIESIAHEEHALHVAREGLDDEEWPIGPSA